MKTCFPAMKGRRRDRRGYLLGDVMLILLLLGALIPGFTYLSLGQRKFQERRLQAAWESYPPRRFEWVINGEADHGK